MAKKKNSEGPRVCYCQETGVVLDWIGYGRPPKYSPDVQKNKRRQRQRERYALARAAVQQQRELGLQ